MVIKMDNIEREALEQSLGKVDEALSYLYEAKQALVVSHQLGVLDILGIDGVNWRRNRTTFKKHDQMDVAEECMQRASRALRKMRSAFDVDIPQLGLSAYRRMDIYGDGPIPDILVQLNINQAREKVDDTIRLVESLKRSLQKKYEASQRPLF